MKFAVVNLGSEELCEKLSESLPAVVGVYHKLMDYCYLRGLPFTVKFFDRDDPELKAQFNFHDRFIYGLRIIEEVHL